MSDDRRRFLHTAGLLAAGSALALGGCKPAEDSSNQTSGDSAKRFKWRMVTTWPKDFPALGTGANELAERITAMSGGRLQVQVYGARELVPESEVFDAVSRGTVEMGHSAAYYWKGKVPEAQFFGAVPFGMTVDELNAWLYHGGGLDLWREAYAPFNLLPFPCGNSGVQMAGWFNEEINSLAGLKGLKMRIPGLGGEVFKRVGGSPVAMPGSELFTALQTGAIDATEWVGPYNDLAFGLHRAAKYYYYPGWQEPAATLELMVNKTAFDGLPADLQAIVRTAAQSVTQNMFSEFIARNASALHKLTEDHDVQLRAMPEDVLDALREASREVMAELAEASPLAGRIHRAYFDFMSSVREYTRVSESAYRDLARSG